MSASGVTASQTRNEFLMLLTTQLQHQDPLEPMKQESFLQQLAQFSTLEGIEQLNASFAEMLKLQQLSHGAGLVGQTVEIALPGGQGVEEGVVQRVSLGSGGLQVDVNGQSVPLDRVLAMVAPRSFQSN